MRYELLCDITKHNLMQHLSCHHPLDECEVRDMHVCQLSGFERGVGLSRYCTASALRRHSRHLLSAEKSLTDNKPDRFTSAYSSLTTTVVQHKTEDAPSLTTILKQTEKSLTHRVAGAQTELSLGQGRRRDGKHDYAQCDAISHLEARTFSSRHVLHTLVFSSDDDSVCLDSRPLEYPCA